tara:strand:- start:380 stop:1060 length:681 start_codon:yes stop_codon:yes gene_type:complete
MASEIRVTNIKANDGTASLTVADSTGNVSVGGTLTSTGAITASGGITNAGTISAGTLGASVNLPSFVGMVASFCMSSVPTGWLACDGSAISRSTYSALFTAIGTTWGAGDGSSTFNLPDLEGAFLRGTGSHGTSNMADGNDFAGPSVGSFENDQFQGHGHTLYSKGGYGNNDSVVSMRDAPGGSGYYAIEDRNGFVQQPVDFGNSSPRYGDETRPFNAGVKYCIKF